ncbi:MAG: mycofactocin system FadH/OYE family oxidoreductase 2 [Streptosporangiaceae bacterium]
MSGAGRYRYLFSPLRVGPLVVRNRIVFSAHLTNYAQDGMPSQQHADYYAARAAGGVGLIITEEHSTHPTDWPYEKLIHGFYRAVIPGYRKMTAAAHAHDVPIFAQLNHNGGQASSMYSRLPVWAPSPVPDPMFREVPKAVEQHEIAQIVAGYGTVAGHCAEGGFDGVELQCSHSSIVRGFLSPATNKRTDGYGGSLERRARILLEIIDVVREAIGPDRALGVRICGDELIEGGSTLAEAVEVAKIVEATGQVDYINTSIGVATATLFMIEASMSIPPGYALFIANAIRKEVRLPVIGVGRIKDPVQAERALADGHCDLVGVVRGQIADPDFAAKARSGNATQIRTCLSCNQECVGRMGLNRWLGCIENPRTGREAVPVAPPRRRGRRVIVVGGGPAGLQAAATAAQRGHQVTLLERQPRTGGQVAVAASVPSRAEFLDVVRNLAAECQRCGVQIKTGTPATAQSLREQEPDAVVLATGARPQPPYWAGGHPRVIDVRDVLEGRAEPSGEVIVVDDLGFHQATSVAELLADRGCSVEIITAGMVVGQDLGITLDMETFNVRAHAKGIRQATDLVVIGAAGREEGDGGGQDGVTLSLLHHPTGQPAERDCDWVVCAVHQAPEDELWQELKAASFEVHRVGDCVTPRRAHAAVIEGHRVAVAL